ncbi:MAG: hypothetical protein K6G83_03265, partial [Lachnospiraceae bacterium]|nr:hypothetical protein [Lachnospiraceae bacterium]
MIFTTAPEVSDKGVLSYTVASGTENATGTVSVVAETQNFNDITFNVNITLINQISVKLKTGSSVSLINSKSTLTYGQTIADSSLSGGSASLNGTNVTGSFAWADGMIKPAVSNSGKTAYTVIFTPGDQTNLNTATCKVTLTVNAAAIQPDQITPPTANALTYNGSAQELVTAGRTTAGEMQYAMAEQAGGSAPASGWSASVPKKTNAGTYYVWYKVKADKNHNDTAAKSVMVTISRTSPTPNMPERSVSVGENVAKVSAVSLPSGWVWNELDREKALVWEQTVYANAEYMGADKGNYVTETVSIGITRAPCTHGSTVTKNAKAANCTETGYTGDTYCSLCGKLVKSGEMIPTNDSHSYESKVTKEPTKLSDGVMTYTCSCCHKSYTQAVPRLQGGEDYGDLLKDTETGDGKAVVKEETKESKDENGNKTKESTVTVGGEEVEKTVVNEETGEVKVETKLWVSGIQGSYTYTGSAIKPEPHVYDGTKKLVLDKDYTVAYSGNKNCGTATVTVSFKGNYASTASEELPFTITKAVLGTDVVAADLGVAKTKKAQTPVPAIRFVASGNKLDAGLFSVSYSPAQVKDAGTYTATITPKDTQNFTGSMTATITVTADKKVMLSKAKVTISPKTYTYTGKEIVPASTGIKVTLNGKTLAYGKDYEISELLYNINPGTATVVLTAVEENEAGYVGSITGTFQIKKGRALSLVDGFSYVYNKSMPYVASGVKPAVTVKDGDTVLEKGKDYTISYSNNKAAGTGRITVKGTGKYSSSVKLD